MRKQPVRLIGMMTLFAILAAACATSSQPSQSQQSKTPSGSCAGQYVPVVEGATYSTRSTSAAGVGSETATFTHVQADSFNIERKGTYATGDTYTSTENWTCTEKGLVQDLANQLAAMYGAGRRATINSNKGVSLPKSIQPGDTWSQTVNATIVGPNGSINGDITYDFTATGEERVTVPAGTFTAMKIAFKATTSNGVLNAINWIAPSVGLVKTQIIAGSNVVVTTELVSYKIQ